MNIFLHSGHITRFPTLTLSIILALHFGHILMRRNMMGTSFPKSPLLLWSDIWGRRCFQLRFLCKIQAIRKLWGGYWLEIAACETGNPPEGWESVDKSFWLFDQISLKGCYLVIFWDSCPQNNERFQVSGKTNESWMWDMRCGIRNPGKR